MKLIGGGKKKKEKSRRRGGGGKQDKFKRNYWGDKRQEIKEQRVERIKQLNENY